MKKVYVYCDVCGKLIPEDEFVVDGSYAAVATCDGVTEVCAKCAAAGRALDVSAIVMAAWRKAAKVRSPKKGETGSKRAKTGASRPRRKKPEPAASETAGAPVSGDSKPARPVSERESVPVGSRPGSDVRASDEPERLVPRPASEPVVTRPAPVSKPTPEPVPRPNVEPSATSESKPSAGPGQHWAEKRAIHERLVAYRKTEGLGSFQRLADAADVTDNAVRMMMDSKPQPIDAWRKVGAALATFGY